MSLKRQHNILATFSMASLTDIIFLLLVFFMVTSTFVFPTALDINLPQSSEQTPAKPATRVFIDAAGEYYVSYDGDELKPIANDHLVEYLHTVTSQDPEAGGIAVYADVAVPYGKVVEVLNIGAANNLKMVLATKPLDKSPAPLQ
ncbi:MAG: ExbD/TolR family protein [Muribaculaceae bacterium]